LIGGKASEIPKTQTQKSKVPSEKISELEKMASAKTNCSKTKNHRGQKIRNLTLDRWTQKC
jgi:hypothetical protein